MITIQGIEQLKDALGLTDDKREARMMEALEKMKTEDLSPASKGILMDEILVDMTALHFNDELKREEVK